jgi:hypothetical protein
MTAKRLVLALALVTAFACLASPPAQAQTGWRNCDAMIIEGGRVELIPSVAIIGGLPERGGFPKASTSFAIQVRGRGCAAAWRLVQSVLSSPDESAALTGAGYRLLSSTDFGRFTRLGPTYRVTARRGGTLVRYVRFGERLRVDSTLYRAGQHLDFLVSDHSCTAAFVLLLPTGRAGLTAGHCSNYPAFGGVENEGPFRVDAPAEPPLGLVLDNPFRRDGPDALVFDLREVPAIQQIERGAKTPITVSGWVPTDRQEKGLSVCFAGRSSGADGNCGEIFRKQKSGERLICARTRARQGDSGGPVYLQPDNGRTRAVGIVKGARLNVPPLARGELCYTPIERILEAFDATLPRGLLG